MKRQTLKTLGIVLLIACVGATVVSAQPRQGRQFGPAQGPQGQRGPGGPGGPGGPQGPAHQMGLHGLLRQLDLTTEQHEAIQAVHKNSQEATEAAREQVQQAMTALHETVMAEAGEEAVRNAAALVGTAIGKEAILRVKTQLAIKAVLTEAQRAELETLKAEVKNGSQAGAKRGPREFNQGQRSGRRPTRGRR
jgi:periplasmic protein CpxP/Spy